jgi:chromosome segregation protein
MTTAPDAPAGRLGIIGSRQLIAVQTMDIARLTAHPVVLIAGTFIAVTGMGPTDSNESGKTSFLSAVSLLLGDPEWRVSGTGAASVEALLFEPVTAGAVVGVNAATEGFIVGVFAEPKDVAATAHTVWMKISATRPHLQVRYAPGLHLARGSTDAERHENAPQVYRSLGGDPLGSTEYAHALYGRSPRVLAYVASRGRVRSRPSLLKLDAGTFTPEQIGDALITLTGRAALFERDQQDRRDLADKQTELARLIERDKQQAAQEDEILRHVEIRARLRSQAGGAGSQWSAYLARAVLDTCARAESAAALLTDTIPTREEISTELGRHRADLESLRDREALGKAANDAKQVLAQRKAAYDAAVRKDGVLESDLTRAEGELRDSRIDAGGHDTGRDGTAAQCATARDDLERKLSTARQELEKARDAVELASDDLRNAEQGQFGLAGLVIRTLGPDVPAVSLADATRLVPETRHQWEARLAPWRDAVCVPDGQPMPGVLQALREVPGAIIISPGQSPGRDDDPVGLPEGILAAPPEALPLLSALAAQSAGDLPVPHASDPGTGIHVVGGFDAPVIGGEDLRAHLRDRLAQARGRASALGQQARALEVEAEHAAVAAARAAAAERVAILAPLAATLAGQLAEHRAGITPLQEQHEAAWEAHQASERALANRDQEIARLSGLIQPARERLRLKDLEIERLNTASHPDDAILAAWGRGSDAARAELRWPPDWPAENRPDRVTEEAVPPPVPNGGDGVERRKAATLAEAARMQLGTALSALEYQAEGVGVAPADLRYAASRFLKARQAGEEDPQGGLFESALADLRAWLDDSSDRDRTAPEQVRQARDARAEVIQIVLSKTRELQDELHQTQEAITQRSRSAIDAISEALDALNRKAGGLGARLDGEVLPPAASDQDWTCRVTPRWRRNPGGPVLPYDNVTNTAQEKLFSIHLVLAALLAAPYPRGRVLILDELADSLGAEHRREVLDAIATVARQHGITVLATCQDAIMAEARPHCGEILYFHYPSKSAALNRPTRMFGLDPNGERVELTAEALAEGRSRRPTDPQ